MCINNNDWCFIFIHSVSHCRMNAKKTKIMKINFNEKYKINSNEQYDQLSNIISHKSFDKIN